MIDLGAAQAMALSYYLFIRRLTDFHSRLKHVYPFFFFKRMTYSGLAQAIVFSLSIFLRKLTDVGVRLESIIFLLIIY